MAAALTTSSPNSIQLRFSLKHHNFRISPSIYIRTHLSSNSIRQIRLSASLDGRGDRVMKKTTTKLSVNSWSNSATSAADSSYSGWVDNDENDDDTRKEKQNEGKKQQPEKRGFGGIVLAGLAGVVFAVGLTLAGAYLNKRIASGV